MFAFVVQLLDVTTILLLFINTFFSSINATELKE